MRQRVNKCTKAADPGDGKTCTHYCDDFFSKCTAITGLTNPYASKEACMTKCAAFSNDQICCRAYHVGNNPAATHCFHAVGTAATGDVPTGCGPAVQ